MSSKAYLSDLAEGLSRRTKLSREESNQFVHEFFDLIVEAFETDNLVKVRGLGTFKRLAVEERESVNVQTGERYVIPAHYKLSFTPDAVLRDEVNKPFADFETVEINDETPIEALMQVAQDEEGLTEETAGTVVEDDRDTAASTTDTAAALMEPDAALTESASVQPEEETETPVSEEPEPEESKELQQEEPDLQPLALRSAEESDTAVPPTRTGHGFWWPLVCSLLTLVIGYLVGSIYPLTRLTDYGQEVTKPGVSAAKDEAAKTEAAKKEAAKEEAAKEASKESAKDEAAKETTVKKEADEHAAELKAAETLPQVEDGEFLIVGEIGKDTMKVGKNLLKISKRHYGSDKYVPYICAMNHITNPDVVPLNKELVLPKLRRKE